MPLPWDETKKGIKVLDYTLNNAYEKIKEQGDIFRGVLGKDIKISKARSRL